MIIWLDVPWNPNRMMYAIVKWSRPFFASIAKCGSMAQHSGILGRSIGWIRPGCGFEDVRRVEMGWDGFFVSPNDFHHCQHEPPKPIGRVNVQLADFVVFPHHFTMILKMLVLFDSMSIFILLAISATLRWADHEIGKKHRKAVRRDLASSREFSEKHWAEAFFCDGCHWVRMGAISVYFCHVSGPRWRYLEVWKRRRLQGRVFFWGSKKHVWRVLSQMDI